MWVAENAIRQYKIEGRKVPTLPTFLVVIKEKISVSHGTKHFGGVLKSMGFSWRKHQSE
jgi:transposase